MNIINMLTDLAVILPSSKKINQAIENQSIAIKNIIKNNDAELLKTHISKKCATLLVPIFSIRV